MCTKYFAVFLQGHGVELWPPVRLFRSWGGAVALLLLGRLYVRLGRLW